MTLDGTGRTSARWYPLNRRSIVRLLALPIAVLTIAGATPAAAHESYTVTSGDTVSHIAVRSGTTVRAIVEENGLISADHVRIGQVLRLPHPASAAAPAATSAPASTPAAPTAVATVSTDGTYTVKPGDTLGHIALRLGVARADLAAANGITDPNRIFAGKVLKVPSGSVVPTTSGAGGSYPNLLGKIKSDPARLALVPSFERWAAANNLPIDLLMAVTWHESGWRNSVVSYKGARGIGQIMPDTETWIASYLIGDTSLDAGNSEDNIRMSARYLRWLIDYLGSEELAIAGYYQGPGAVRAGRWYESTEFYVASVQANRSRFIAT